MSLLDQDSRAHIEQACRTAEEFTKHYYEHIDKRRSQIIQRFYLDSAVLVWNGNGVVGAEAIGKFICELPLTEHKVGSLDAQRILDTAVGGKLAFLVTVGGMVKYGQKNPRAFTQNFMLTSHNDKWKVVSDCFRCVEPL